LHPGKSSGTAGLANEIFYAPSGWNRAMVGMAAPALNLP
jgi:hypothetical protein